MKKWGWGKTITMFLVRKINNEKKANSKGYPYGFNYLKEYHTHKIVGRNKYKLKYGAKYYEKYSLWKEHIEHDYSSLKKNDDLFRYLKRKYRNKITEKELAAILVIPMELAVVSLICYPERSENWQSYLILITCMGIVLAIILTFYYWEIKAELAFLYDFCEIMFGDEVKNILE